MKNKKPKVILLVAGEGTRLRPHTLDRPKCMVEIDGISLIDRQLAVLKAEGLDDIVMIGGYMSDMLIKDGIRLEVNSRYYETNMVWTLFSAEEELKGDVIISYGDIVYSNKILQKLLYSTADVSVVVDKKWEGYWRLRNENPLDDAETLKLQKDGAISEIGQKPKSINEIEGQYIGLMKFSSKGIEELKKAFYSAKKNESILGKKLESAYMTDLLQYMIDLGVRVDSVLTYDNWIEVDTVSDLESEVTLHRLNNM